MRPQHGVIAVAALGVLASSCSLLVQNENTYDRVDAGMGGGDAQVDAGPRTLSAPVLRFPWNGFMTGSVHTGAQPAERNALRPRFVWRPVEGAEHYEIQLTSACEAQTRADCTFDGAITEATTTSEWRPEEALAVATSAPVGRRYVWRVRACDSAGCSDWSPVRYVEVGRQPIDFNADGYADAIVGAPGEDAMHVVDGPALDSSQAEASPADMGGAFGSVVAAGDLTADGYSDALVWSESDQVDGVTASRAYRCVRDTFGIDCRDGAIVSPSPEALGQYGRALAAGCDIDGNGIGDFVVGAPQETVAGASRAGRVYVYLSMLAGSAPEPVVIESPSIEPDGNFGVSVDCGSDLDGDGFTDIVIGAPGEAGGGVSRSGRVYLYRGGSASFSSPMETHFSSMGMPDGFFGRVVVTADLFGDLVPDLVITALGETPGGIAFAGRVHVLDRSETGARVIALTAPTPAEGGGFGYGIDVLSRHGEPGLVVVGSVAEDGQVWSIAAQTDGTFAPAQLLERPAVVAGSGYGARLGVIGDVGGDGAVWFSVGAPGDTDTIGRTRAGSAWIYRWDGSEPPVLHGRIESSEGQASGWFGSVGDTSSNAVET